MTGAVQVVAGSSVSTAPAEDAVYTSPGTYTFVPEVGVTSVCVVCVGGGGDDGGGGGGLGWKNNITVIPGNSYTVVVGGASGTSYFINTSTCAGYGNGGGYVGTGGGSGGAGGSGEIGRAHV